MLLAAEVVFCVTHMLAKLIVWGKTASGLTTSCRRSRPRTGRR